LTLIKAGLPILSSLELLAKRQKEAGFRGQLEDVAARVKTGESISKAFEVQGNFPLVYTTTLLAGERSGNLEEVLQRYLDFQRVALTFRKKLTASLIYPCILVVMMTGLLTFLISVVVPRFAELYDQLGTKLPGPTLFLLALGHDVQHYGIYAAIVLAIIVWLIMRWSKTDAGALLLDRVRVKFPLLGSRLAQIPGGPLLAHARHAAHRRSAAGSQPGDGGSVDRLAPDCPRRTRLRGKRARRQRAGAQPGEDQRLSRAGRRND
jgi:type IV pilus assembly protein PilC